MPKRGGHGAHEFAELFRSDGAKRVAGLAHRWRDLALFNRAIDHAHDLVFTLSRADRAQLRARLVQREGRRGRRAQQGFIINALINAKLGAKRCAQAGDPLVAAVLDCGRRQSL